MAGKSEDDFPDRPDHRGPKPDGWDDKDWLFYMRRWEGHTYRAIAAELGTTHGALSHRARLMRAYHGERILPRSHGNAARRKGRQQTRAAREAYSQRWQELRALVGGQFGRSSIKAAEIIEQILDRYLGDPEMMAALTLDDAKALASIAKIMGERADVMVGPLPTNPLDTGPSTLFEQIDRTVTTSRAQVTLQKIDLIVEQFPPGEITPGDTGPNGDQAVLEPPDDQAIEVTADQVE